LIQLNSGKGVKSPVSVGVKSPDKKSNRPRRSYPKVYPKYRNPDEPSETWSGRGKQPRWLVSALKSGKTIADFEISEVSRELVDA
jgi:DNA-binding protein H-NS